MTYQFVFHEMWNKRLNEILRTLPHDNYIFIISFQKSYDYRYVIDKCNRQN